GDSEGDPGLGLGLAESRGNLGIERRMVPLARAAGKELYSRTADLLPVYETVLDSARGRHMRAEQAAVRTGLRIGRFGCGRHVGAIVSSAGGVGQLVVISDE